MKALIVEDETVAYTNLKRILYDLNLGIEVVGNTESVVRTAKWLQESQHLIDIIFMDIHLSDGSAFKIFEIVDVKTPIIFTTAFDQYAIEAFKVNSIDYLLKPIEAGEVKHAIEKFRERTKRDIHEYLNILPRLAHQDKYPEKILIPFNDKIFPVAVSNISCFYTTEVKTIVILKDGTSFPYKKTLEYINHSLNPDLFFRANKQYIISKDSVKNITIWFDNRLLVTLHTELPENLYISKNKAAEFKQWLAG
ncbi:LytTR family DNA-binding domain-containing protein [uncultured Bacteroides sp.]|uniref:LytR/AlgR family response regulator transcription factor n=1 Tax=uncultured Bacteroides sp. TaxID=162156 RepID=UPI002AA73948|nr:LytTR family DNA-binding domain-containing protein [uncultured Bacteroides sp.]